MKEKDKRDRGTIERDKTKKGEREKVYERGRRETMYINKFFYKLATITSYL